MVLSGVAINQCQCEDPDFDVFWRYRECPICGRMQKMIDTVFCKKCGGRIPINKIPKEFEKQEVRCNHTDIEKKLTVRTWRPILDSSDNDY